MKIGVKKICPQGDSTSIVSLGLLRSAHDFERGTQVEVRNWRVWRRFQHLLELRHRFGRAPERAQRPPQIVARLGVGRIDRNRALETRQRFNKISAGGKYHTSVVMRLREIRLERYRAGNQCCGIVSSQLMRKHARDVERASVVWSYGAGLPAQALRVGEPACAMVGERSSQDLFAVACGTH